MFICCSQELGVWPFILDLTTGMPKPISFGNMPCLIEIVWTRRENKKLEGMFAVFEKKIVCLTFNF